MDILDELDKIGSLIGGGSEAFQRVDTLVNHILIDNTHLQARVHALETQGQLAGRIHDVRKTPEGHFFNCEWVNHTQFQEGDLLFLIPSLRP